MKLTEEQLLIRFGNNLNSFRKSKNLTLRELSDRCRIDYSNIGKIEKGKINISLVTIVDLAIGLDIAPKKLLDFEVK
jgi:transcriptional regulator with XRE-family HTH domain